MPLLRRATSRDSNKQRLVAMVPGETMPLPSRAWAIPYYEAARRIGVRISVRGQPDKSVILTLVGEKSSS